jgi:hypothetical protein
MPIPSDDVEHTMTLKPTTDYSARTSRGWITRRARARLFDYDRDAPRFEGAAKRRLRKATRNTSLTLPTNTEPGR